MEIRKVHMGKAKCAADISNGSERGEYVNMDYVLYKLGRPMRSVNLMYCYYPLDEGWPLRARDAFPHDATGAWDYPYDDYFPYEGGLSGNKNSHTFEQMKDIRRHGQDVTLTLTIDPHVSDDHLIAIAKDLRPYGRMFLRINHEATGSWFSFNRRCSYKEVGDFFVRFHKIIKEYAPNVSTILCIGGIEDLNEERMLYEDEFAEAVRVTDIFSVDKYLTLHYGWPCDVAEKGGGNYYRRLVSNIFKMTERSYQRFCYLCGGKSKPMMMSEFNADGDVNGPYEQCSDVTEFFDIAKKENADWLSGFVFYQFRDRGRLGLEIEDPNNPDVGIEQPVMQTFKKLIYEDRFLPEMKASDSLTLPAALRWGGAEDAEGIELSLDFTGNPTFCEVNFTDDSNVMMEINGKWFYKSPKAKTIDLMAAFYEKPLTEACSLTLRLFYPPADGINDLSVDGGDVNSYTTVNALPDIRIRFEPVA